MTPLAGAPAGPDGRSDGSVGRSLGSLSDLSDVRVLVVVPVLNEVGHIAALLESLLASASAFRTYRVVVVDGGSTDGTRNVVAALAASNARVSCIDNPLRFQSAGVNLAVEQRGAEADILIRCDAHASYPGDFCVRLVETLVRRGADSVVVPMDTVGTTPLQRAIAWVSNSAVGTGGAAHRGGHRSGFVDHGHHAACRVDTFCRVGGYDATFSHNEDAEFDCRQRRMGARIWLDATTRLSYYPRATWRALAAQYFRYGAGRARTLKRHPQSLRLRQLLVPLNFVACVGGLAFGPLCRWALAWPTAYLTLLLLTSVTMASQHRSADGLLAGPAAGAMHVAWACGLIGGLLRSSDHVWAPQTATPLRPAFPGSHP
ncbi:MAG TPA: glycosyltransferase family 2 protein [Polyangiaceae bacterium]|jgi:succinoglycan biosynthesis protein ExoA|nr:glycosyltransferase family 2 protein [Polyangiaceae bacterium]